MENFSNERKSGEKKQGKIFFFFYLEKTQRENLSLQHFSFFNRVRNLVLRPIFLESLLCNIYRLDSIHSSLSNFTTFAF